MLSIETSTAKNAKKNLTRTRCSVNIVIDKNYF